MENGRQEDRSASAGAQVLDPMFRMPTQFGPASGPRNVPQDRQHIRYVHSRVALTVSALSDTASLAAMLPPGCTHAGEPLIQVNVTNLTNLGWLAGRGYNIVLVQIPNVTFAGKGETVTGTFIPVVWESLTDAIITGREELGVPKIFADIPDHVVEGDSRYCSASWHGYRFFEMEAHELAGAPPPQGPAAPLLFRKYIPKTGDWGVADVDCMTTTGKDPNEPPTFTREYRSGSGSFRFLPARWEDMPTQYMIVNRLSALPLREFRSSILRVTSQEEVETRGGGNLCGQRVI